MSFDSIRTALMLDLPEAPRPNLHTGSFTLRRQKSHLILELLELMGFQIELKGSLEVNFCTYEI